MTLQATFLPFFFFLCDASCFVTLLQLTLSTPHGLTIIDVLLVGLESATFGQDHTRLLILVDQWVERSRQGRSQKRAAKISRLMTWSSQSRQASKHDGRNDRRVSIGGISDLAVSTWKTVRRHGVRLSALPGPSKGERQASYFSKSGTESSHQDTMARGCAVLALRSLPRLSSVIFQVEQAGRSDLRRVPDPVCGSLIARSDSKLLEF